MDRSDVITLISKNSVQTNDYSWVDQETRKEVFCDVRSITQTEWFEAGRNGIDHPAFIFIMNRYEYLGQQIVEYNGQRYGVYRTYKGKNESLELYCEAKGGVHTAPEVVVDEPQSES